EPVEGDREGAGFAVAHDGQGGVAAGGDGAHLRGEVDAAGDGEPVEPGDDVSVAHSGLGCGAAGGDGLHAGTEDLFLFDGLVAGGVHDGDAEEAVAGFAVVDEFGG